MTKESGATGLTAKERIPELLRQGLDNMAVAAATGADRRVVANVRRDLGMPPVRHRTTLQQKVERGLRPREDGHTGWEGRKASSGAPTVRQDRKDVTVSHVAFQSRTGRPPVGMVKSECGFEDCLTPEHVSDELERRNIRAQERALYGLDPKPWDVCPKGLHDWEESGRFEPDLTPYCRSCNTIRVRSGRQAKKVSA